MADTPQGFNFGFTPVQQAPQPSAPQVQDDNGPAQITRPSQYPTATRIEDGIAYDASGKKLGSVDDKALEQTPQAAPSGPAFNFGFTQPQTQGQPKDLNNNPPSWEGQITGISAGPKPMTLDERNKAALKGSTILGPVGAAAGFIGPQWFEDLKNDLDSGSDSTWVGWLMKKAGAKGLSYGNSPEVGHMIGGPIYGPAEFGHGAAILPEHPIKGTNEMLGGVGHALGPLAVTQPEAIPFIAVSSMTSSAAQHVAKQMGADDDTAELIGNVTGLVAGGKTVGKLHLLDSFETHTNSYMSAQHDYVGRVKEFQTASNQARVAEIEAAASKQLYAQGGVSRQILEDTLNKASEARANATKAQKALDEVRERRDQEGVKMRQVARQIQGTKNLTQTAQRRQQEVAGAHEDFRSMAPPTKSGPAAYSNQDLSIARGYLENAHTPETPVNTVEGIHTELQNAVDSIDNKIDPMIEKYGQEPITTNVRMDVRDQLAKSTQAGFTEKGMKALEKYDLADPTMTEARDMLKDLNAEYRGTMKRNNWDVATALRVDPEFAAQYAAANSLRAGIDGTLQEHGVDGVRQLRSDQASLIKVRSAVENQLNRADQVVRGTGRSGVLRQAAAFAAEKASTAAGAKIGGVKGAVAGNLIGGKLGELIAPGDLTKDQLAARSMNVRGAGRPVVELSSQGTPSVLPVDQQPPDVGVQLSPKDVTDIQRENGPLHSALASHYGQSLEAGSYGELESQFLADVDDKKRYGVRLEPEEQKLLTKLNEQNAADRLAAQQAAVEAEVNGEKTPTATLPDRVEPVLDAGKLANGMNTQEAISHDLAHVIVGNELGFEFPDGVRSHLHGENVKAGSKMSAPVDLSSYMDEDGVVDPKKMKADMADIAATYVAGGVMNDLYHGVPFTENRALGADMGILRQFMKQAGFNDAQASRMIAIATDKARGILERPGVSDVIQDHASIREAGLDERYHVSPDRMEQILADVKGTDETTSGNNARTAGKSERTAKENGTGAERPAKEGNNEELRPNGQGRSEGEARPSEAASRPTEPKFDAEPELTHRQTEKGGEVRLDSEQEGLLKNRGLTKYTNIDNETAAITASNLDKDFRGQGLGKRMYEEAGKQAKAAGKKYLTSDLGGQTSMDAAQVWESLKKDHPGEIEGPFPNKVGSPGYRWNLQGQDLNPKFDIEAAAKRGLKERTTGSDEHDQMIRNAGAIPAGNMGGELPLYHDPTSGSTLATPKAQMSEQAVRDNLARSRADYSAAAAKNFTPASPEEYRAELDRSPHVATLTDASTEDLKNSKIFKNGNGAYYSITPDGEIAGVVNNGPVRGQLGAVMKHAVENGGTHLNAWDINGQLPKQYEKYGFKTTKTEPYDVATYGEPSQGLKDAWKLAGWKEGEPYPSVTHMALGQDLNPKFDSDLTDRAIKHYGTTDDPKKTGYILRSGAGLDFSDGQNVRTLDHGDVSQVMPGVQGNPREQFINQTGAARLVQTSRDTGVVIPAEEIPTGQKKAIMNAVENHPRGSKRVLLDVQKPDGSISSAMGDVNEPEDLDRLIRDAARKTTSLNPKFAAEDRVSTRVPSAVKATENPLEGEPLTIDRAAIDAAPGLAQKMADRVRGYDGLKIPKNIKDPQKVLDRFQGHVEDNLRWIYKQVEPEVAEANKKWYESANQIANDISETHGMEPRQGAGVIAAMSPQKDWDMNVSLAQRIADIYHTKRDFKTTPEMMTKAEQLAGKSTEMKKVIGNLEGKTFNELTEPFEKAAWARIYDETYNPRDFNKIDPGTGEPLGPRKTGSGANAKAAWGTLNEIAKALSIMKDGSRENISGQLGGAHKVRNFYNNIIDPTDGKDVTIDTHAVAAGHMMPLGGNAPEVLENFNGAGSNQTGSSGTYPVYADAYRNVAQEFGLKPRELQSVVWEWARNLFDSFKTENGLKFSKDEWQKVARGEQTADEARQNIAKAATEAKERTQKTKKPGTIKALDFINALKGNNAGVNALQGNLEFPTGE